MKLSRLSVIFSIVLLLLLTTNGVFVLLVWRAHSRLDDALGERQLALDEVRDLRRESELLARLVDLYTHTGNSRFLLYYYEILGIREGDKPRLQQSAGRLYWERVIAGETIHRPETVGVTQSLRARLTSLGFDAIEMAALGRVFDATEAMKAVEQVAFATTQGLYDPSREEFVSEGVPDREYAARLVNSDRYNRLRLRLLETIQELVSRVDQRTSGELLNARQQLQGWILAAGCGFLVTLSLAATAMRILNHQILGPLRELGNTAGRLAERHYHVRIGQLGGVQELKVLGAAVDTMAQAIEDDIREREHTRQELLSAWARSEAATRAKSQFLANMSHEIRTPMNAIIGMLYLTLDTRLTTRQRDYLHKADASAKALVGIIDDILDFSKVEAGKLELESIPFHLEQVIADALFMVQQGAREQGIELLFDPQGLDATCLDGELLGDPVRLGQVLSNLLSNAVKFTRTGHVCLCVRLDREDAETITLEFSVEDTGIGITPKQTVYLFQEFTQADGSTTRKHGGTGLGLAISKHLVELMGGNIWVQSIVGEGSSFHFTACLARAPGVEAARSTKAITQRGRILLVENHPRAREALLGILRLLGADQVVVSTNSVEAVAQLRRDADEGQTYGQLLLDWDMPDMGAEAVLTSLSEQHIPLPDQVVAFCSQELGQGRRTAEMAGVSGFIEKPVMPGALLAHLLPQGVLPMRTGLVSEQWSLHGMRVLLVDDNPLSQQLAVELLHSRGVQIDISGNGLEALEQLSALPLRHYDLVLMDLEMPEMDGYETTRRLRSDPRYADLPIVAMTAHALAEKRKRGLDLGMNDYLTKPFEPRKLFGLLAQYHKAGGTQSPTAQARDTEGLPTIPGLNMQRTLPSTEQAGSPPNADAEDSGQLLRQLRKLLEQGDAEALDLWSEYRETFVRTLPQATMQRLGQAMRQFDFGAASVLLDSGPPGSLEGNP